MTNQSIVNSSQDIPTKSKSKKIISSSRIKSDKVEEFKTPTKKKSKKPSSVSMESPVNPTPKPAINSSSILSLTLPNASGKNKALEKQDPLSKKKPRHWEKRWVLIPNVFEFTKEIWLKKWVLVDGGEDIYDSNNFLQTYYSSSIKPYKEVVPKKYQCNFDECGKIFMDSASLRKHMLTHGERHFICKHESCGKKFLDNSKLRRHQLVHTGEKPFKCDLCNKKFSLDFNLKTHLRTHTGEKPYICSFSGCDKRFTQSSNLTAHEKTHKEQLAKIQALTEKKELKQAIFGLTQDIPPANQNQSASGAPNQEKPKEEEVKSVEINLV